MNSMKVLLVDDSKSARYALRLQLQRHGVKVETAEAAEAALERVRAAPPDAIFMDHTMPGMNGFEALDILKGSSSTAHIPVIMCTSNEDPEFIAQAEKKGATAVLSKATAPEKLEDLLAQLQREQATPAESAAAPEHPPLATDKLTEEHIRALTSPILDEHAERLTTDLIAKLDERLRAGLDEEAERLQQHFLKVQGEQAQLTAKRMLNEVLPQAIRHELEQERENTARMVQEVVDGSLDSLAEEPKFAERLSQAVVKRVNDRAEQIAKRTATEVADAVATKRVEAVAEGLLHSSRGNTGLMYLLAAGAALVGIASAAAVFFLLS